MPTSWERKKKRIRLSALWKSSPYFRPLGFDRRGHSRADVQRSRTVTERKKKEEKVSIEWRDKSEENENKGLGLRGGKNEWKERTYGELANLGIVDTVDLSVFGSTQAQAGD